MKKDVSTFLMQICNNIRKIREARDIKQEELAKALQISTPTLSKIENGSDFHLSLLEDICAYFKIDIAELMPICNSSFNFNNSPHSNGNYYNYANDKLIEMLNVQLCNSQKVIESLLANNNN